MTTPMVLPSNPSSIYSLIPGRELKFRKQDDQYQTASRTALLSDITEHHSLRKKLTYLPWRQSFNRYLFGISFRAINLPLIVGLSILLLSLFGGVNAAPTAPTAPPILIGQSVPLSGSNQALGMDIRDGALTYLKRLNEQGGINGRPVELITLDDANDTKKSGENARILIEEKNVIALFGYASATLSQPAIPEIEKRNIPFLSPFTGADVMRKFHPLIFNHRASYSDEIEKIILHYTTIGIRSFGILYHDDPVGKQNMSAVERSLTKRNLKSTINIGITRTNPDIALASRLAIGVKPEVIIITTLAKPSIDFVKTIKAETALIQFASTSFSGPNLLMKGLDKQGAGTVVTHVVPAYTNMTLSIVREYRRDWDEFFPKKEMGATSFESYIATKLLVYALRKVEGTPSPSSLLKALNALPILDLGGFIVSWKPDDHNGSSYAEMMVIDKLGQFRY